MREIGLPDRRAPRPSAYTLERAQVIPVPPEVAFAFFEDPQNLRLITPDWLDFRISSVRGTPLDVGTTIFYRIRWLGLPITWVSRITEFERNRRFVDVQIRGPYRSWRHEHTFEEHDGQTFMRDTVRYELPLGILGRIAHRMLVKRQLGAIFDYRASQIRRIFPGNEGGRRSCEPS
ncbi:MAG: CDP-paratose 2-epimerase [Gemmatimonadales bacterium]|nr:CDP-paratose 2-epimerase [Gemmatimonadales bacterium]